ncbi:MAG: ferrochelatase [Roseiflexus sp.]|jgi:ferrochelatase|nr:ferrochelatase [Roseiflexus sp.]MBO9364905.1 ferrochelatase [Roseiflexus sp.]MBO9381157.1 ferrochelatase [Roseiflexus sp.]MBO9388173.1 ferrochelatase [Roseiflexus sp.]
MTPISPPVGIFLLAYGTPESLDDVEPYFTHIRGGRKPSPEAVANLRERYRLVGGRTPLKDLTFATADKLQARLDAEAPGRYRVYVGMKHWHPFIAETMPHIAADGVRDVVALVLAPHYSRMSVGGYRRYVDEANATLEQPLQITFIERWHDHPGFRRLIADRIVAARAELPPDLRDQALILFSAHSLPERILSWNDPYPDELRESAAGIASLLGLTDWRLCYQSAGMTGEPWLGPDILDYLEELHSEGVRAVISAPFGFVADHLEVLWDIDREAQDKAAELGMELRRIRMPNADDEFVDVLVSLVRDALRQRV